MWEKHPMHFLKCLKDAIPPSYFLEFSKYEYQPETNTDQSREVFLARFSEVDEEFLNLHTTSLKPEYEFALQSRIYDSDKNLVGHLPLVDFLVNNISEVMEMSTSSEGQLGKTLWIYKTGRSFHGYFPAILKENEWLKFMASLILWNKPTFGFHITDPRWCAHGIKNGYSALRWSNNSSRHKSYPELFSIEELKLLA